jgi:hypothetical protein
MNHLPFVSVLLAKITCQVTSYQVVFSIFNFSQGCVLLYLSYIHQENNFTFWQRSFTKSTEKQGTFCILLVAWTPSSNVSEVMHIVEAVNI